MNLKTFKMKKKIIFGVFALSLISINIAQSIQNKPNFLTFQKLVQLYTANAEQLNGYTVEYGADIGGPRTISCDCHNCGQKDGWEIVYQPTEIICEKAGNSNCPDGGGKIISEGCWAC